MSGYLCVPCMRAAYGGLPWWAETEKELPPDDTPMPCSLRDASEEMRVAEELPECLTPWIRGHWEIDPSSIGRIPKPEDSKWVVDSAEQPIGATTT